MESISIVHPDNNNRTISFKFTNTTENDKDVYIKDITLYTFLRNIDWVNNVFSWVEIRKLNTSDIAHNGTSPDTIHVPILCCARIPPGRYKNTEMIVQTINNTLQSISEQNSIAITGVDAIHGVPGSAYDIAGIEFTIDNTITWYPAVIDSSVISNGFDISIDRTRNDYGISSNCIPVLEYNGNTFTVPTEGTDGYNNLLMYNYDILSKMNGSSLTSHAISFINSITATLTVDSVKISPEDLYTSEFGLIRFRENGSNYTEFIVNPNNTALIAEIQEKYAALNIQSTDTTTTLDCFAYPFFPTSEALYIRAANTEHLDKLVESQLSSERVFGSSIAYINVSTEWSNKPTDSDYETLDIITSIGPQTVAINSVITVPKSSTTYIYVTGNNQRYPLWRSTHTLTYRVIN